MLNRKNLLEEIIKHLDITPTMYKNATEKYENMGEFLKNQGIECEIYPQGSFRTGTVVRPNKNGKESDYDIDMICEVSNHDSSSNPETIYNIIGNPLRESERYKDVTEDDCCFTIKYADIEEGIGFSMDIVPSVHDDIENITRLIQSGVDSQYADEAILITAKNDNNFYWGNSNPRGYALWFDNRNEKFKEFSKDEYRQRIFESNSELYNFDIEKVPEGILRTSLQRVVQILKRHRDIFYGRLNSDIKKPISAIISTLTAQISENASYNIGVFELLEFVVSRLEIYSELTKTNQAIFEAKYPEMNKIKKDANTWSIKNPVNDDDNYTENWTEQDITWFFKWIENVEKDLISRIEDSDMDFYNGLEIGLGEKIVNRYKPESIPKPTIISKVQPWSPDEI